jgi:hypothetical protein
LATSWIGRGGFGRASVWSRSRSRVGRTRVRAGRRRRGRDSGAVDAGFDAGLPPTDGGPATDAGLPPDAGADAGLPMDGVFQRTRGLHPTRGSTRRWHGDRCADRSASGWTVYHGVLPAGARSRTATSRWKRPMPTGRGGPTAGVHLLQQRVVPDQGVPMGDRGGIRARGAVPFIRLHMRSQQKQLVTDRCTRSTTSSPVGSTPTCAPGRTGRRRSARR